MAKMKWLTVLLVVLSVGPAITRSIYSKNSSLELPDINATTLDLLDLASSTAEGAEAVDYSPHPSDIFPPNITTGIQSSTTTPRSPTSATILLVENITTTSDGTTTTKLQTNTPLAAYLLQPKALPVGSGYLDRMSLGPIEISSILHQIMTSSGTVPGKLRNGSSSIFSRQPNFNKKSQNGSYATTEENLFEDEDSRSEGMMSVIPIPDDHDEVPYQITQDEPNPYVHWDIDSEEEEKEMEKLQKGKVTSNNRREGDNSGFTTPSSTTTTGRSYLLLLAGNSTIVRLRQRDFAKYLKLNLAARLSLEYDDVKVNRVVLAPPRLLVNVSVVTPSDTTSPEDPVEETTVNGSVTKEEAPLHKLAETNATLLELSGEEYHVVRLLRLRSDPPEKDTNAGDSTVDEEDVSDEDGVANDVDEDDGDFDDVQSLKPAIVSTRHDDVELVIYTVLGGACAVVIVGLFMVAVSKYFKAVEFLWPWKRPKCVTVNWNPPNSRQKHHRMGDDLPVPPIPPKVIYSGSFAARAVKNSSWMEDYHGPQIPTSGGTYHLPGHVVGKSKLNPKKSPMYADLDVGGSMMLGYEEMEAAKNVSHHRQSPSKLHIFSCRPGSVLIPLPPHSVVRANMAARANMAVDFQKSPLDVRIKEEGDKTSGHDNPTYQT